MQELLSVEGLCKDFLIGGGLFKGKPKRLRAVDNVSLTIHSGETLSIVGESGCGKTTLGRLILRLLEPDFGSIIFNGQDITHISRSRMRPLRKDLQVVFQDPYSSLNPRLKVFEIIAEPLQNFGYSNMEIKKRVAEVMDVVGLPYEYVNRHPHAFSGGQRQRIGIARALVMRPKLIVCDEAVSALDVSIQAQVLNLFADIQSQYQIALFFISHNLGVVRHISQRVAVMYLGNLVELALESQLFESPLHPYTQALISAVPDPHPDSRGRNIVLEGDIPSPFDPPSGCPFHPRCPRAEKLCRQEKPVITVQQDGHLAACHYPGQERREQ
jgi:oligopeptide/dipeptide ABC transporter ATP-binding protein